DEQAIMINLARSFNRYVRPHERNHRAYTADGGTRPGDRWAVETAWLDILGPHGWGHVYRRGKVEHWRRPGKDRGISGTTGYGDHDLLFVFTSNGQPFEMGCSYSKFAAYALLNHHGDFSAAARALVQKGYGSRPESDSSGAFGQKQGGVGTAESQWG